MKLSDFFKRFFLKFSSKEDKRGEILIKGKVLGFLKKEISNKDFDGKWKKVNIKNNEACLDAMFEG